MCSHWSVAACMMLGSKHAFHVHTVLVIPSLFNGHVDIILTASPWLCFASTDTKVFIIFMGTLDNLNLIDLQYCWSGQLPCKLIEKTCFSLGLYHLICLWVYTYARAHCINLWQSSCSWDDIAIWSGCTGWFYCELSFQLGDLHDCLVSDCEAGCADWIVGWCWLVSFLHGKESHVMCWGDDYRYPYAVWPGQYGICVLYACWSELDWVFCECSVD